MNKVFKVIWSKVRNAYVVVSEIAKNTVSGVGKRNRVNRFSLGATLAAAALTSGFFLPNGAWAAEEIVYENVASPGYYAAIAIDTGDQNPFDVDGGSITKVVASSEKDTINVPNGSGTLSLKDIPEYYFVTVKDPNIAEKEYIYKYNRTSVTVAGKTYYYWVREGFGVKAITERYHPEATDVKIDLFIEDGYNYNGIVTAGEHSSGITDITTAINGTNLDKIEYLQYAAITNSSGTGTPTTYDYYIKQGEQYVNVGDRKLLSNFYYLRDEHINSETGKYQFNGIDIPYEDIYTIGTDRGVFLSKEVENANSLSTEQLANLGVDVYGGAVYGKNNEILLSGYNNDTNTWSTVWAAEVSDPNATIQNMTRDEFNEILQHLHEEDIKLVNEGIVTTKVTNGKRNGISTTDNVGIENGGSINLINKVGNQVPGIIVKSVEESGFDTQIVISDKGTDLDGDNENDPVTGSITLNAGSRVKANGSEDVTEGSLTKLSINGKVYSVATSDAVEASKTVVKHAENQENVTVRKLEKQNGESYDTYEVAVKDMRAKSGVASYYNDSTQLPDGSKVGDGTITLTNGDGTTATVTGLHDYYATGLSVQDSAGSKDLVLTLNNGETVKVALNDITAGLGTMSSWKAKVNNTTFDVTNGETVEYIAGSNISLSADASQKITVATTDSVTFNSVTVKGYQDSADVVINQNGINAGSKVITKVADGYVAKDSTDAVNGGQLWDNTIKGFVLSNSAQNGVYDTIGLVLNDGTYATNAPKITGGGGKDGADTFIGISGVNTSGNVQTIMLNTGSHVRVYTDTDQNVPQHTTKGIASVIEVNGEYYNIYGSTPGTYSETDYHLSYNNHNEAPTIGVNSTNNTYNSTDKAYKADENGILTLYVEDRHAETGDNTHRQPENVYIADVASKTALDNLSKLVGDSLDVVEDQLSSGTDNNVVNHISNLYSKVTTATTEAGKHSTVVGVNKNIIVSDENDNGAKKYIVKLSDKIVLGTGNKAITIDGTMGDVQIGRIKINNAYDSNGVAEIAEITGLTNTTWNQTGSYTSGRAATEEQLQKAISGVVNTLATNDKYITSGTASYVKGEDGKTTGTIALVGSNGLGATVTGLQDTTLVGGSALKTNESAYGRTYKIKDTADNEVVLEDVASASKLQEVDGRLTTVESRVSSIETNITNVTSKQIENGKIAEYDYVDNDGVQKTGTSMLTLVTKGDADEDIVIDGLRDTTLRAATVDAVETKEDGKLTSRTYTFSDTNGNNVILNDIASASKLENVEEQVITNTETIKEHTTHIENLYSNDQILSQSISNSTQYLDSRINQLGSRVNKVGAGAAALAALHPMDFDPDDKLSFAVGAGNYAGENATALGAFYRPNEKVMMSVGGTYGNGENMVNMGVSFALDRTNNVSNSRTAMAKEIVDLREQVATQGQQIAQLVALVQQLTGVQRPVVPAEQLFPDVPQNHWAYEYVNGLIAKGIIEGYPDGTFGGDRAMTRYEFAAMLFRAMEQGVVLSEQVRQEFEPELGRIRVDRVKGTDADLNKIERVRVNRAVERDDYGTNVVQVKH